MRYERVKVKRDLQTMHNKAVPPWEIPVLEFIFEDGNVERLGIFEEVDRDYPNANVEFARLAKAYGSDPKSGVDHVASVYGNAGAGVRALRKEIDAARQDDAEADEQAAPSPPPPARRNRGAQASDPLLS
jgi:hypothetical protein